MKAHCAYCGRNEASFRPGNDATTGEAFTDLCCDECNRVLATLGELDGTPLAPHPAPAAPSDGKWVPLEATLAMIDAFHNEDGESASNKWAAMLAAAPASLESGLVGVTMDEARRNKILRFAVWRFMNHSLAMATAAAQDRESHYNKPGAAEAFFKDAEDASAILASLRAVPGEPT